MKQTSMHAFSPRKTAFLSAAAVGLLTHMPAMVILLNNHDNLNNQPMGYGAGVTSGRWMLQLLGETFQLLNIGFNLPFFNGLVLILMLACTAVLITDILNIHHYVSAGLIGALMTAFPAVASTLMFRFASVYYGIAIFLTVLAPWLMNRSSRFLPLAALCIGCSMGIYQAYVPVSIAVFVLMLLHKALEGQTTFRDLVMKGVTACLCLALGLGVYLLCMKLSLKLFGVTLTDYQGIDQMGSIPLSSLPRLLLEAVKGCILPLRDYCGLAWYPVIRLIYGLLYLLSLVILVHILRRQADKWIVFFSLAMILVLPVAVNFIVIMCPDSYVYTLMVYGFFLLGCIPVMLLEYCEPDAGRLLATVRKATVFLTALLITGYIYQTSINYTAAYFINRQGENYVSSLVTQVRMTDEFDTEKQWAFLGEISDPLLRSNWQKHISIGGFVNTPSLLSSYCIPNWLQNYCGYAVPLADQATMDQLWESDEVRAMPCWPNAGSIRVIGDTVVIKCQNQK